MLLFGQLVVAFLNNRHLFSYASFRYLFFARLLTVLGNGIAPIALSFAILDMGGSAADLGVVVASRSFLNVIFILFGGVLADRYSRQALLSLSSLGAALSQGVIAWMILDQSASILWLAIVGMLNGAAAGVALPASAAMVPQTVPAHKLREANAFIQSGVYGGTILGASIGGILTSAVGPGWGLAIDALGFALSAPLYRAIQVVCQSTQKVSQRFVRELCEGWSAFTRHTWVWVIVAQFSIINAAFSGVMMILGPVIADDSFGRGEWGIMVAMQSVGLMSGSFVALRWRPERDLFVSVIGILLCTLPMISLAQAWPSYWIMCTFFIAGLCFGFFGVVWAHSLQTHIPAGILARVYAYDAIGSYLAIPLGEVIAGPLSLKYGNAQVLLYSACAMIVATLLACRTSAVRALTHRACSPLDD